jgi:hypothetical protein
VRWRERGWWTPLDHCTIVQLAGCIGGYSDAALLNRQQDMDQPPLLADLREFVTLHRAHGELRAIASSADAERLPA